MRKKEHMISPETRAQIRRYFYAEHWKIGTIARELNVHPDAVRNAIESDRFNRTEPMRACITDPYMEFVRQVLDQYPRLRATRIHQMIRERGYTGSVIQLRRAVARLRPAAREPFLKLQAFPAEQAQVDWAHFGQVAVGRARRTLSCFVATLSWSRALYLEFFFDQTMENFLRGHVHAFEDWSGQPRVILYDNLRSAVLERRGNEIHFNRRLMELCAHYHFVARPCQVRAGNQKGRVERAIRYVRESFWPVVPSLPSPNATGRRCSGAIRWRTADVGRRRQPHGCRGIRRRTTTLADSSVHPFPTDLILPCARPNDLCPLRSQRLLDSARSGGTPTDDRRFRHAGANPRRTAEIARHHRTYDRHQLVLDPAHQQALLKTKRKAFETTPGGRLALAAPETKTLLDLAFAQGESAGSQTAQLLKLLDLYGPAALRRATSEALDRNTPRASSVAFLLRKQQRSVPAPMAVDLSRHRKPRLSKSGLTIWRPTMNSPQ